MVNELKSKMKSAKLVFSNAKFAESNKLYKEILSELPNDITALIYTGYISLLNNKLDEAEKSLKRALDIMPKSNSIKSLLADVYYRKDDFKNASGLMGSIKRKASAVKLDYLKSKKVYEVSSSSNKTELRFIKKDPLPLVEVKINGASPVNFLLDTGGPEVIIDTEYAKVLGLKTFGTEKDGFGGGKKGTFEHSYINSIQLGDFQVKNVPVILLETKRFSSELYDDNTQIMGIIGTVMFYHFLTTLDYINNKIEFEIVNEESNNSLKDRLRNKPFQKVPFWIASEHFMLVNGKINNSPEMLFFIDTGLGGASFTCPKSTLKKFNFTLENDKTSSGLGGGGKIKTVPFTIGTLKLGEITENNAKGLYGPFPTHIETSFGFKIEGLISHGFFKEHTVIFDFSEMMLYISK
jgi:predicted aspartyl protease